MPTTSYMPAEFDTLFDWITVKEIQSGIDYTRRYDVVHIPQTLSSPSGSMPDMRRLTIRLFGVVGNCNLAHLGNWDRYVSLYAEP